MIKKSKGVFSIGTSNIVVPGNKQSFPVEFQHKSRLNYYSSLFNSLEVNSSFYKLPKPLTFAKWALDVPELFRFSVKLWKGITHVKQLNADPNDIDRFFNAANNLAEKKGCLLVQFPASITADYRKQVEKILQMLNQSDHKNQWPKAIEFRSLSWYTARTNTLLDKYHATMVLHDIPKSKIMEPQQNAPFFYFRFHGIHGDYRGSYSDAILEEQAKKIRHLLNDGKDVYAYFNNTIGNAFENAISLKAMV